MVKIILRDFEDLEFSIRKFRRAVHVANIKKRYIQQTWFESPSVAKRRKSIESRKKVYHLYRKSLVNYKGKDYVS